MEAENNTIKNINNKINTNNKNTENDVLNFH